MKHDLLHIQGKPYVLVPLHEYRQLVEGEAAGAQGNELPAEVLDRLTAGQEAPLRILRRHRGLTQDELAQAAELSRPYLTEIETGVKIGSIRAMQALAQALAVDVRHLLRQAAAA